MKTLLEALQNKPCIRDAFPTMPGTGVFFTVESNITGQITNVMLDVTQAQVLQWANGASIQDAMPQLSADHRELLLTGITSDEWKSLYPDTSAI